MRRVTRFVVCVGLLGGCFEEGGESSREAAALTTATGLMAFGDIQSNLTTDPAAAGEALLEFIKWPVAADQLLSPPFDVSMVTSARINSTPTTPVPACLAQSGKAGCDNFTTTDECEAGEFTFVGAAARRCAPCDDVEGLCAYRWSIPRLGFAGPNFDLEVATAGSWLGAASQITPNVSASYKLTVQNTGTRTGTIRACACTPFTVERSNTPSGKPRKLVNSSFLVVAAVPRESAGGCALVEFDGEGKPSVSDECFCRNGGVCKPFAVSLDVTCGNASCDAGEDPTNCPEDCTVGGPRCGNSLCESPESELNCPVDCGPVAPTCGNAMCEFGENSISCFEDCPLTP